MNLESMVLNSILIKSIDGKTYKNFFESKHADSRYVGTPFDFTYFASSLTASYWMSGSPPVKLTL